MGKMPDLDYHEWREMEIEVARRRFPAATKPGLLANGEVDPAISLLTAEVEITGGDSVAIMNGGGGGGILAAVLAPTAGQIWISERNVVAFEATRRTIALNSVTTADVLPGHGAYPFPPDLSVDVCIIRIPHEKVAILQLLRDAFTILKEGGRCYLAGATTEGIKSAARILERQFGSAEVLATGSGHRVVRAHRNAGEASLIDELSSPALAPDAFRVLEVVLRGEPHQLHTRPGVFSWEHLDEATEMLARRMEVGVGESVLDLGCGSGALGLVASRLSAGAPLRMVDADVEAVRSARRSAEAANIDNYDVRTSDIAAAVADERFDVVVTNPPFHVGKSTDLDLPRQFILDSWEVLNPGGRLFLVANRTLPYERLIEKKFGAVEMLEDGRRFKVLSATKR
jgi:16S rRNA (guanine1207-N2)-methyltransferase